MKTIFAALALAAAVSTAQADVGMGFDKILQDTVQPTPVSAPSFPVPGFDKMIGA